MGSVTRADLITQTGYIKETYSDFTDNFTRIPYNDDLALLRNELSVRQAIFNLIFTAPSERFFNPFFGCGIQQYLFEPLDALSKQNLINSINNSVTQFEPRANVQNVDVNEDTDNNKINITITFIMVNRSEPITLSMFLERVR